MAAFSVRSQALGMLTVGGGAITPQVPKDLPAAKEGIVFLSLCAHLMVRLFYLGKFLVMTGDPRGKKIS